MLQTLRNSFIKQTAANSIQSNHIMIPSAPIRVAANYFSLSSNVNSTRGVQYSLRQSQETPKMGTLYFPKPSETLTSLVQSVQESNIQECLTSFSVIHEQIKRFAAELVKQPSNRASKTQEDSLKMIATLYYDALFKLFANHQDSTEKFININEKYSKINEVDLASKKQLQTDIKTMTAATTASTIQNSILILVTHGAAAPIFLINGGQAAAIKALKVKLKTIDEKLENNLSTHNDLLSGLASILYKELKENRTGDLNIDESDLNSFVECSSFFGIKINTKVEGNLVGDGASTSTAATTFNSQANLDLI